MNFQKNVLGHPSRRITKNDWEKQHHWTRHKPPQDESIRHGIKPETKGTLSASAAYFQLWQYSSPLDWVLRIIGAFAALGGGTAYPLMTIIFGNLVNDFNGIALGLESPGKFRHSVNHNAIWFVYLFVGKFGV
jgi:hypothetical protein